MCAKFVCEVCGERWVDDTPAETKAWIETICDECEELLKFDEEIVEVAKNYPRVWELVQALAN